MLSSEFSIFFCIKCTNGQCLHIAFLCVCLTAGDGQRGSIRK